MSAERRRRMDGFLAKFTDPVIVITIVIFILSTAGGIAFHIYNRERAAYDWLWKLDNRTEQNARDVSTARATSDAIQKVLTAHVGRMEKQLRDFALALERLETNQGNLLAELIELREDQKLGAARVQERQDQHEAMGAHIGAQERMSANEQRSKLRNDAQQDDIDRLEDSVRTMQQQINGLQRIAP